MCNWSIFRLPGRRTISCLLSVGVCSIFIFTIFGNEMIASSGHMFSARGPNRRALDYKTEILSIGLVKDIAPCENFKSDIFLCLVIFHFLQMLKCTLTVCLELTSFILYFRTKQFQKRCFTAVGKSSGSSGNNFYFIQFHNFLVYYRLMIKYLKNIGRRLHSTQAELIFGFFNTM